MDKRVIKTKRNLKQTLLRLIKETPLEKITVTQICKEAETSRITFYTYYEDKYALVAEMLDDAVERIGEVYRRYEAENVQHDARTSYRNFLESLMDVTQGSEELLVECSTPERNPYINSVLYQRLSQITTEFIEQHEDVMRTKYSVKLTATLLCNSILSVIHEMWDEGAGAEGTRSVVRSVYEDLLDSRLFIA